MVKYKLEAIEQKWNKVGHKCEDCWLVKVRHPDPFDILSQRSTPLSEGQFEVHQLFTLADSSCHAVPPNPFVGSAH
jgi:hypothetical protein